MIYEKEVFSIRNSKMNKKWLRYQDYVIRDGNFIGEFENMYIDHNDPWSQIESGQLATFTGTGLQMLERIKKSNALTKVLELGCGLGDFANRIHSVGYDILGVDISLTAIKKARARYPKIRFEEADISNYQIIMDFKPDIIVMSEITWYILDDLKSFLSFIKSNLPNSLILHLLSTYPEGSQSYGKEYFIDLDGILEFFKMVYIEYGQINKFDGSKETFFLGAWSEHIATQYSTS